MTLGTRRHDLDWVRIIAFMLLILYHVGMYYVTWDWHVKSPAASPAIEPLMLLTAPWRLSLLFLVSGVATGFLLERRTQGFLGSRSLRLLVPLVFGMVVIVPPQSYLEVVEKLNYPGSFGEFYRLYLSGYHGFCKDGCLALPTWNHLWFVVYLWVYTVVLWAVVRLAPVLVPRLRALAEQRLGGLGILLLPAALLALARLTLGHRFPQTHALVDDWYDHAMFFPVFVLGFALAGTSRPWAMFERARWHSLGGAVLGWGVICGFMGYFDSDEVLVGHEWVLVARVIWGLQQWLAIAAVLGFAHRHLKRDNAARRYLTAAIFPVYILHQTVIVIVAHTLKPAHFYPPVEALLLVLVTAASCFLGVEVIRRVAPLRPLFGMPRGTRTPLPAQLQPAPVTGAAFALAVREDTH